MQILCPSSRRSQSRAAAGLTSTTDFHRLGTYSGFQKWPAPAFMAQDLVTVVKGKHTFKFGFEYRNQRNSFTSGLNQSGHAYYDRISTGCWTSTAAARSRVFCSTRRTSARPLLYAVRTDFGALEFLHRPCRRHLEHHAETNPEPWASLGYARAHGRAARCLFVLRHRRTESRRGQPSRPAGFAGDRWGDVSYGKRFPENLFKKAFAPRLGIAYASRRRLSRGSATEFSSTPATIRVGRAAWRTMASTSIHTIRRRKQDLRPAFLLSDGFPERWRQYRTAGARFDRF